jgi:hypothetical protein
VTGDYSQTSSASDSASLTDSGNDAAGGFTVTDGDSDTSTAQQSGNTITGDYNLSQSTDDSWLTKYNEGREGLFPPVCGWQPGELQSDTTGPRAEPAIGARANDRVPSGPCQAPAPESSAKCREPQ